MAKNIKTTKTKTATATMGSFSEITDKIGKLRAQAEELSIEIKTQEKNRHLLGNLVVQIVATHMIYKSKETEACSLIAYNMLSELWDTPEGQEQVEIIVQKINDTIRDMMGKDFTTDHLYEW